MSQREVKVDIQFHHSVKLRDRKGRRRIIMVCATQNGIEVANGSYVCLASYKSICQCYFGCFA